MVNVETYKSGNVNEGALRVRASKTIGDGDGIGLAGRRGDSYGLAGLPRRPSVRISPRAGLVFKGGKGYAFARTNVVVERLNSDGYGGVVDDYFVGEINVVQRLTGAICLTPVTAVGGSCGGSVGDSIALLCSSVYR